MEVVGAGVEDGDRLAPVGGLVVGLEGVVGLSVGFLVSDGGANGNLTVLVV